MSPHRHAEHDDAPARAGSAARRGRAPDGPAAGLSSLDVLQRQAGNRAVAGLLGRPRPAPATAPVSVQTDPPRVGRPPESPYQLHLDPEIEAQIRAIEAMRAMVAPEPIRERLLDLTLPPLPPSPGAATSAAPSVTPPAPAAATPTGPAPGTGLMGPRAGTGGDVWKAVLAEPSLGPAITALGEQAAARAQAEWHGLSTGEAAVVVGGSIAVGGGTIVALLANPDVRTWITTTLNDKIIPVPKVPGLGLQLNLAGDNLIVGLHLDVGRILPAALGFGPASATTPLGTPFPETVQRQAVPAPEPSPGRAHVEEHAHPHEHHGPPVVQRDPIPGGVGGATTAATGGAVGLRSIEGSFVIPGGKLISGTFSRRVSTTSATQVSVQITSQKAVISFSAPIYIDAQWPVQNMAVHSITHTFVDNATTSDVRLVDDELGDGFIDQTSTARASLGETVGQIIRRTVVDRARTRPDPVPPTYTSSDRPTGQGPPPYFGHNEAPPALAGPYDPLQDPDPQGTLAALAANLGAMPSEGEHDEISAAELSRLTVGATITVNKGVEQLDGGTGLRIAAGTAVSLQVDSGASVPKLKAEAGKGTAAIAAAADIQAIHASSSGVQVIKDGKPIATIDRLTIARGGTVKIDHLTLLGEAAEAASTERGLWSLVGGILGAEQARENPFAAASATGISDDPVVVPGIARGILEGKLQTALTDLLATHGRTLVPGVDLGSVLGVPGGPVKAR